MMVAHDGRARGLDDLAAYIIAKRPPVDDIVLITNTARMLYFLLLQALLKWAVKE